MDTGRIEDRGVAWAELLVMPSNGLRILAASGAEAALGLSLVVAKEGGGLSLADLIHPDDRDELLRLGGDATGSIHLRLRDAEGAIRCVCGTFRPDPLAPGAVALKLVDARQLSSVRGQPAISPEMWSLLENCDDYVYFKNRHYVLTACSRSLAQVTGRESDWNRIVGTTDYELFPEEHADLYYGLEKKVFAGEPVARALQPFVDPQGRERWADNRAYPIRDQHGEIVGLFGVARDVTNILHTQGALRESESLLRTVIDEIPDPLQLRDESGAFLLCNQAFAQRLRVSPEQTVGYYDEAFGVAPAIADAVRSDVRAVIAEGRSEVVYQELLDPSGGPSRHVRALKKPFEDSDGRRRILILEQDITDLQVAQQRVIDSERRLQTVLEVTREGVWDWHLPTGTMAHNRQWYLSLGYEEGEVGEDISSFFSLIHPHDRDRVVGRLEALASGRAERYHSEHRMLRKDGSAIWVQDRGRVAERDAQAVPVRVVGSFIDVTEQREHKRQLEFLAHYDALTGLPNRVLLADRMKLAMAHVQRRGGRLVVAYLDLDGFKEINDSHGHGVGDQLLTVVAAQIKGTLRDGDTIARLGGDEFVAVLTDLQEEQSSVPLVMRLLDAVAKPVAIRGASFRVTGSVGVTFYPQDEDVDADQLLRQADQAMYQAKLAGKSRYHFFDAERDRNVRGRNESLKRLEQALERGEFVLYYQPKVNLRSGEVIGAEALLRWQHPDQGLLAPGAFLPELEREPLGVALGEWVLDEACAQMAEWARQGLELSVSVNVSAHHLQQTDFPARLRERLAAHADLPAGRLELEVLETSALDDVAQVMGAFETCAELGVRIALDDFGTGYSSLTYLRRLPAHMLKIDRSFVAGMLDDPDDLAILEGVIGLGNAFRLEIVAEGVETLEQGILLLLLGCELAQGYVIAKPMPGEDLLQWIEQWEPPLSWLGQRRIRRELLPAVYACVETRASLLEVERFASDQREDPPVLDPVGCRLGRWLELVRERYSMEARFGKVEAAYLRLIEAVGKVMESARSGKADGSALADLVAVREETTRHLLELLDELGRRS